MWNRLSTSLPFSPRMDTYSGLALGANWWRDSAVIITAAVAAGGAGVGAAATAGAGVGAG